MNINFAEIPNHQNLFLDYLYEFENVSSFYFYNFRKKDQYSDIFRKIFERENPNRSLLKKIILEQYSCFENLSNKTSRNLEILDDKKTLFVITGQQLGIFGGPLYTFYKIITAIKLSSFLNERFDDYYFVPLFWMESDDHDFEEVNSINILNDSNNLISIFYKEINQEEELRESVGTIVFDEAINNVYSKLESELRNTEFKSKLLEKLKSIYTIGKTFKEAFRDLLFDFFDKYGLIIFDPQDAGVKNLLKPIFLNEIKNFREHTQKLVSVSAALEERYHAQVKIKPVNLFYTLDNNRYSIEPDENFFKLKRKRKQFTFEEILSEIENHPERFSPNVLLRPITQDYLFNTAFYIAGPSEISYFAQVNSLYEFFNLVPPIIYPRASATILEKHLTNFIEKYNLDIKDIFFGEEHLKYKVFKVLSEINIDDVFNESNKKIEIVFDDIKQELFRIDKTLSDSVNKYKERVSHLLNDLQNKSKKLQETKFETVIKQLKKLSNLLYPNQNLQEREINFIYFYNKYGPEIIDRIFEEINIQDFEHKIILL
ncbi:MAG: bacillithiol biosynthesis cysteine-adding enzyme BshC [Ignavibacterium sp.]|nr:bacillithiol biosynthesis cysteine-adding enzyme BshC [Ignavibacterium sp.]